MTPGEDEPDEQPAWRRFGELVLFAIPAVIVALTAFFMAIVRGVELEADAAEIPGVLYSRSDGGWLEAGLILLLPLAVALGPYLVRGWSFLPRRANWRIYGALYAASLLVALAAAIWLPPKVVIARSGGVQWGSLDETRAKVSHAWTEAERIELACTLPDEQGSDPILYFNVVFPEERSVPLFGGWAPDQAGELQAQLVAFDAVEMQLAMAGVPRYDESYRKELCLDRYRKALGPESSRLLDRFMTVEESSTL